MRGSWCVGLLLAVVLGCVRGTVPTRAADESEVIDLPAPELDGDLSLEESLATRHSVRSFTRETLTWREIGQLLWAAQGVTRDWGARTAPSAGALYPLEVYVVTRKGLYHYLPAGHEMIALSAGDLRQELWRAALRQDAVRDAPAVFVLSAVYERTSAKYGMRAERYVHLETGHAAQNLLLQAVALGLGGVPIGAMEDEKVGAALDLPVDQRPLYLIPVGHPEE